VPSGNPLRFKLLGLRKHNARRCSGCEPLKSQQFVLARFLLIAPLVSASLMYLALHHP
jgi:hypothetical protein